MDQNDLTKAQIKAISLMDPNVMNGGVIYDPDYKLEEDQMDEIIDDSENTSLSSD